MPPVKPAPCAGPRARLMIVVMLLLPVAVIVVLPFWKVEPPTSVVIASTLLALCGACLAWGRPLPSVSKKLLSDLLQVILEHMRERK